VNNQQNGEMSSSLTSMDAEAIRCFHEAITSGKHWYRALLGALGQWQSAEEDHDGRHYRYLIEGTALDWLLLAERLLEAVDGLIPDDEKEALLLHNQPPLDITRAEFRELIGETRYKQYLNYFYGVTVERALVLALEGEVRKERHLAGYVKEKDTRSEAYRRIYGATESVLLEQFRKEKRYRLLKSISLDELKEFTYWLFRYRLKHSDKERVASDTKKALEWARRHGLSQKLAFGSFSATVELG
jgi:hypothetical protein